MIKTDLPILRARFPKPQPKDDRNLPTPWRYPSTSIATSMDAFEPGRISRTWEQFHDAKYPKTSTYSNYDSRPSEVVALERVMVWAMGAELATKREFLTAAGQRSPGADAYAAKLRKMNMKICWGREPAMTSADAAQVRGRLQAMVQKPVPDGGTGIPGYRLKKPCKHCPFSRAKEAIRFSGRVRAAEILNQAYQHGFPCHESAVNDEDGDGNGGYHFGPDTQHCAGALMMFIADGQGSWPGVGNDRTIPDKLLHHLDWNAPYFSSEAEFMAANTPAGDWVAPEEGHDDYEDD
jgi:hypothetical protein